MARAIKLTPIEKVENFAVIIRCIHERGPTQQQALIELERRGLWLSAEQKQQAGITGQDEANARKEQAARAMLAALKEMRTQLAAHIKMDVKRHSSLMLADVAADKAIALAESAGIKAEG